MVMVLKLTQQEIDITRTALILYSRTLNEQSRPHCAGYSTTGIDLCVRRMNVEALVYRMENGNGEGSAGSSQGAAAS